MNVITARFTYGNRARTDPITRLDYGWILRFENANLPETYQVDFSNDPSNSGTSKTSIGNSDGVEIPQEFCVPGKNVYGFVYLVGENSGRTRYFTETFVQARPDRSGRTPTPTQQDTVDQAIAALNAGVSRVETIADAIPPTIDAALEAAKESGEFDGPQGPQGETGPQGPQGVPGQDYVLTEADKEEIVHMVLDIYPAAEGVSF